MSVALPVQLLNIPLAKLRFEEGVRTKIAEDISLRHQGKIQCSGPLYLLISLCIIAVNFISRAIIHLPNFINFCNILEAIN